MNGFWQGAQQLNKVFLPWIGFRQSLYFLTKKVSDFLKESPEVLGQDGGRGKEGGGIETVLLEMAAMMVVPLV